MHRSSQQLCQAGPSSCRLGLLHKPCRWLAARQAHISSQSHSISKPPCQPFQQHVNHLFGQYTSRSLVASAAAELCQTADSWGLEYAETTAADTSTLQVTCHVPLLLLVDGTNIGCISAASSSSSRGRTSSSNSSTRAFRPSTQERFAAWLQFLSAFANSLSNQDGQHKAAGRLAATLVAFDNKGSSLTNVRAQILPDYLSKRYPTQARPQQNPAAAAQNPVPVSPRQPVVPLAPSGSSSNLSGWSELATVLEDLNNTHEQQQKQKQQQQQQWHLVQQQMVHPPQPEGRVKMASAAAGCSYLAAHAAYGFEADDVIAAAVQWCRTQLNPAPLVMIASSDSDMQQLLDDNTYWLELLQVPSAQHPSGLALHSAAEFRRAYGFEPSAYPDYLALTGKKEASIPSVGLSSKLAKTLLAKFGCLEGLLSARDSLKPFGAAHKLLGEAQPGADVRCATAARNLAVLRMRPQQQQLPVQQLQDCYGRMLDLVRQQAMLKPQQQPQPLLPPKGRAPQGEEHTLPVGPQEQGQAHSVLQQRGYTHVSQVHPARLLHIQQCRPYVAVLQECLGVMGLTQQQVNWTSPGGLCCDLLVCLDVGSKQQGAVGVGGTAGSEATGSSRAAHQQEHQRQQQQQSAARPDAAGASNASAANAVAAHEREAADSAGVACLSTGVTGTTWLAFQVLGPADLCAGLGSSPLGGSPLLPPTYRQAAAALAQHLADRCGCFKRGTSALGHAKRSLLKEATGGAKRQLTLLRSNLGGIPVAVVPFYELADAADTAAGATPEAAPEDTGSLGAAGVGSGGGEDTRRRRQQQQQQKERVMAAGLEEASSSSSSRRAHLSSTLALEYVQAVVLEHCQGALPSYS